ncbi:MAG TPA: superoxide dismutase [Pseudonocardiaceae bacterium]|jgi:Cu-Zn family superoxide dismutase|nr:superoxide dismutase [Pseudonocardiaceae bacterium]
MELTLSDVDTTSARARGRLTLAALGVAVAFAPLACSSQQNASQPATSPPATTSAANTSATSPAGPAAKLSGGGTLAAPEQATDAFTYDPALAPVGAYLAVTMATLPDSTRVELDVSGLLPNRGYAVHLHAKPCGPTGAAAGPHFQHQIDPAATPDQPSTNPEFANPRNEIWLDVRTDATGSGTSSTEVPFVFTDRRPASVVVHKAMATATGPGQAGMAGERIACVTLPDK